VQLTAQALAALGATMGAGSLVTEDEFRKRQITVVADEKAVLFSRIPVRRIFRGTVAEGRQRAGQAFVLYRGLQKVKTIRPHLVFPKPAKDELRLYISETAFMPEPGSYWYIFVRSLDASLGLGWASSVEFSAMQRGRRPTRSDPPLADDADEDSIEEAARLRDRITRSILVRRGQAKFRKAVRARFQDKCCITSSPILELLEAAHIEVAQGKDNNHPRNGLLLRTDMHTMFDLGLLAIDPDNLRVQLRPDLQTSQYGYLQGKRINVTPQVFQTLNRRGLKKRWHDLPWTP
jgi:hypothetical protein